jgi:hypothetical protein
MLKPADRGMIGTLVAFPNVADSQRNAGFAKARRLMELEAENAKLRDTAIALLLEIHELRTGSARETKNTGADEESGTLIESAEVARFRHRRAALRHFWRRGR